MDRELEIQGVGVSTLAQRYGTPLFLYDGDVLRHKYEGLRQRLHPAMEIFYSLKANPNISICALLASLGARAEVSSLVELISASRAGVAPQDIIFLGPGKSLEELEACLDLEIYAIICESFGELAAIDELARRRGRVAPVALRVNPDFAVKGAGLTMGGRPRQFGIDSAQLLAAPDLAARFPHLRLMGVQAYLGTRILSEEVVVDNVTRIFALSRQLSARLGFPLEFVDVGGGLGVAYFDNERDLDIDELTGQLDPIIDEFATELPATRLGMELGRYLTAESGTYVVRVRYVKTSMGESFAVTDGGTNHHMAAVGVGSPMKRNFPIRLLNRLDEAASENWQVCGPLCTPNDTIGKNVALPAVAPGDLIGVLRSGAYGSTASPGLFLSHGFPAEVLVDVGQHHLVRERDVAEDLLRPQRLWHAALTREATAMEDITTQAVTTQPGTDATEGGRRRIVDGVGLVLGRVLKQELRDLSEETRLMEDLNLDSTSVLELLLELEDELGIQIDVEDIERRDFQNIGTVADLVTRQSGG